MQQATQMRPQAHDQPNSLHSSAKLHVIWSGSLHTHAQACGLGSIMQHICLLQAHSAPLHSSKNAWQGMSLGQQSCCSWRE